MYRILLPKKYSHHSEFTSIETWEIEEAKAKHWENRIYTSCNAKASVSFSKITQDYKLEQH